MRLGIESRFYGYLQSLPRETVGVPVFWEVEELCGLDGRKALLWLMGTEASKEMEKKKEEGLDLVCPLVLSLSVFFSLSLCLSLYLASSATSN